MDDDEISITSTLSSEPQEEYEIDAILAERTEDGQKQFLVSWNHYDETYHTWEPRNSFNDKDTFVEWQERKAAIASGQEQPFDLSAWEQRLAAHHDERRRRKKIRRQKRRDAGLTVASSADSTSSSLSPKSSRSPVLSSPNEFPVSEPISAEPDKIAEPPRERDEDEANIDTSTEARPQKGSALDTAPLWAHSNVGPASDRKAKDDPTQSLPGHLSSSTHRKRTLQTSTSDEEEDQPLGSLDQELVRSPSDAMDFGGFRNLQHRNNWNKKRNADRAPKIGDIQLLDMKTGKPAGSQTASPHQPTYPSLAEADDALRAEQHPMAGPSFADTQHSSLRSTETGTKTPDTSISINPRDPRRQAMFPHLQVSANNAKAPEAIMLRPPAANQPINTSEISKFMLPLQSVPDFDHAVGPYKFRHYPTDEEVNKLMTDRHSDIVNGRLLIGPDHRDVGRIRLGGLTSTQKSRYLKIKTNDQGLVFHAYNYARGFKAEKWWASTSQRSYASGFIVPSDASTANNVDEVAQDLCPSLNALMVDCSLPNGIFSMLIWPHGSQVFNFFERRLPSVYPGTMLRFIAVEQVTKASTAPFKMLIEIAPLPTPAEEPEPEDSPEDDSLAGQLRALFDTITIDPFIDDESVEEVLPPHKNELFLPSPEAGWFSEFRQTYYYLIAPNRIGGFPPCDTFFLAFHPIDQHYWNKDPDAQQLVSKHVSAEHDVLVSLLREQGVRRIYSMQDLGSTEFKEGAWEAFRGEADNACIVLHEHFIHYGGLRGLGRFLRKNINVYKFDPRLQMDETRFFPRLFPHGSVIALPDSLFMLKPNWALRIVQWFERTHRHTNLPGTAKLYLRKGCLQWLGEILDANILDPDHDDAFDGIYLTYYELSKILHIPGLGLDYHSVAGEDYEVTSPNSPIRHSIVLDQFGWEREVPGTKTKPFQPDRAVLAKNDEVQVMNFGEMSHPWAEEFRIFQVVLPFADNWSRGFKERVAELSKEFGHLEFMSFNDMVGMYGIPHADLYGKV